MRVLKTEAFSDWFKALDRHAQRMVDGRLTRIVEENHFGTVRRFDGLIELKWLSGLRVYAVIINPDFIVLLGGNKNGQQKDIKKAKKILREIISSRS